MPNLYMRIFSIATQFICLLCLLLSPVSEAVDAGDFGETWQTPNWDRDLAMLAAARIDSFAETDRLLNMTSQAVGAETLLKAMTRLTSRSDWPAPAREAALLQFTHQLRQLPPYSVDPAVLDYLHNYQNLTLIPHDEAPHVGVPMYAIRAAASGLENHWGRLQAALNANAVLANDPAQLLALIQSNPSVNIQGGIELALGNASNTALRTLLDHGLPQLSDTAALTGILGKAAVLLEDSADISAVLINGRGHSLTEIARLAKNKLPDEAVGNILLTVIDAAPASTAAMLIAELAPQSLHYEDVSVRLLQTVSHPELGSTAALVLAQWGSDKQRRSLRQLALADSSSLAAKRIQTALSLGRSGAIRSPQ